MNVALFPLKFVLLTLFPILALKQNVLTKQEMIMHQLRNIFKTLQVMKLSYEAEIDLDRIVLPLKYVSSLQILEEQLQSNPDLQKQLVCWHSIDCIAELKGMN